MQELQALAAQSAKEIRIGMEGIPDASKTVAAAFARKFPEMTPVDLDRLMKVLGKVQKKEH